MKRISQTRMQTNLNDCSTNDYECPICRDTGWLYTSDENGYEYATECSCGAYQKKIMNNMKSFAALPKSFAEMRLSSFDTTVYNTPKSRDRAIYAVRAIECWLDNFENMTEQGMGLYLYSNTKGSGKTRMAASIANELMYEKHIQVKFATSLTILNEIKASWDRRESGSMYTESQLLDYLSTTPVLIIDDFGTETVRDWISERFYQIINSRYVDKKITIFTSNTDLKHLNYDSRITNRIIERTYQVPFPEESVRDIIGERNMLELIKKIKEGNKEKGTE